MMMAIDLGPGGNAGWVLLALPWLLLLAAAWRAGHAASRRTQPLRPDRRMAMAMTMRDDDSGAAVYRRDDTVPAALDKKEYRDGHDRADVGELATPSPAPAPPMPAVPEEAAAPEPHESAAVAEVESEGQLVQALQDAEAGGEPLDVSRAALHLARWQLKNGGRPQAEALLLRTVMIATRGKFAAEHAEARIELAELSRVDGDMTTACEHWQMAKQLFHDLDRREDTLRMADHMRLNRCPSDWILTGF